MRLLVLGMLVCGMLRADPPVQATLPVPAQAATQMPVATPAPTSAPTAVATPATTPVQTALQTPVATPMQTSMETPMAVSPSVDAEPLAVSKPAKAFGHSGVTYAVAFSNWIVFNGSPLAYTPFEMGYDFGNGFRAQTGIDIFDYEGDDHDPSGVPGRYSYEMTDWRTSVLYRFPMSIRLRPLVGMTVDAVGGGRTLTPDYEGGIDVNANSPKISAWGYFGCGVQAGLEYLITPDWSVQLSERYDFTFTTVASPIVTELGAMVTF
jgi:hypothetical protein